MCSASSRDDTVEIKGENIGGVLLSETGLELGSIWSDNLQEKFDHTAYVAADNSWGNDNQ